MGAMKLVREGLSIAGSHKRLVLVLWLVPLVPALALGAMAAANLAPNLGRSLFADYALDGGWFVVWSEFRSSRAFALGPIVSVGVAVMAVLTLLLQVAISAGVVETLIGRRSEHPFVLGVRRNFLRFLRTTGTLLVSTAVVLIGCRLLAKGFFRIAEARADGRIDLLGLTLAGVLFIVLWAPLDLAADLSRISAARHDERSMVRGFFRAWWAVIRKPGLFVPLYLVFLLLPLALHAVYTALRAPWTPSTAITIAALMIAQQIVMVGRACFKLGFWGAEVAAFHECGEPRWCRARSTAATSHDSGNWKSPPDLESPAKP